MRPYDNVSMDFIVALLRTQRGKYAILMAVDRFSKMAHFIPSHKTNDASYIAELYFKKVVGVYSVTKTIVSNRNLKFLSHL